MCFHETVQWWKQGAASAEWIESIPCDRVDSFFQSHQEDFSPEAVYRAKTLGRVRSEYQLSFVDLGLMPLVEKEVGEALEPPYRAERIWTQEPTWVERCDRRTGPLVAQVRVLAGLRENSQATSEFRISRTSCLPMSRMFSPESPTTTARTHSSAGSKQKLKALAGVGADHRPIQQLGPHDNGIAGVRLRKHADFEKETRASLGTHSTPSYLVDYIVGNLADWIEEIPENDRSVFEPACGHAAFLVVGDATAYPTSSF